jgi:hypothetical protein
MRALCRVEHHHVRAQDFGVRFVPRQRERDVVADGEGFGAFDQQQRRALRRRARADFEPIDSYGERGR